MRLALFDDWRLGVIDVDAQTITDVTGVVPGAGEADPLGAGWWVRMCRDFEDLRSGVDDARSRGHAVPLDEVRLRPPVLNPGKVVATASNYGAHVAEMREVVLERVAGHVEPWLLDFDVFLKATSSVIGPGDAVVFPSGPRPRDARSTTRASSPSSSVAAARRSPRRGRSIMCSATRSGST